MVAVQEPVAKGRFLTGPEDTFCRLIACQGLHSGRAYRIAWKTDAKSSKDLAPRVLARPHVAARIAELRAQVDRDAVMSLNERRRLLADTAKREIKVAPSHGERIAAIREDSILAGERRADGSVQVAVGVDLGGLIASLRSTAHGGGGGGAVVDVSPGSPSRHVPEPVLGDLSRGEGDGSGSVPEGRQTALDGAAEAISHQSAPRLVAPAGAEWLPPLPGMERASEAGADHAGFAEAESWDEE